MDVTGTRPQVLREGALSRSQLDEVLTPLGWSVGEQDDAPAEATPDDASDEAPGGDGDGQA